jgi:hypothetical protein
MSMDKSEIEKQSHFKIIRLEMCDRIYQTMEDEKEYSWSEMIDIGKNIIETQLKPIYGDLEIFKNIVKTTAGAIGTMRNVDVNLIRIKDRPEGELYFKELFTERKLSELLNCIRSM